MRLKAEILFLFIEMTFLGNSLKVDTLENYRNVIEI